MNELREIIAKAINEKQQMNVYGTIKISWYDLPPQTKQITLGLADAVIEVIQHEKWWERAE